LDIHVFSSFLAFRNALRQILAEKSEKLLDKKIERTPTPLQQKHFYTNVQDLKQKKTSPPKFDGEKNGKKRDKIHLTRNL
jgi:hypothetical protein